MRATITEWNRGAERLYGYRAEEAIGRPVAMLVAPELGEQEARARRRVFAGESVRQFESVRITKEGERVAVSLTMSPVRDATGAVVMASTIARDISERKRYEGLLRRQAELLELAHDAVIVREPVQSRVSYWNREAEEIYGYRVEQAVGQVTHDLLQTVFPVSREAVDRALIERGRWEGELSHRRKDGTRIVVASRQALQRGEQGEPIAVIAFNSDITARVEAEGGLRLQAEIIRNMAEGVALVRTSDRTIAY